MKTARALVLATVAALAHAHVATALPTMVRLGYGDCAACHVSPQGGGPLTVYGRGIDRSQSLRGGDYTPSDDGLTNWNYLDDMLGADVKVYPITRKK